MLARTKRSPKPGLGTETKSRTHSQKQSPTKGELTANRLLDAAEALFAEKGFEGATLREIARRAGIHQPGLYNHFASKQALYAAVLDRALAPMAAAMQEHLSNASPAASSARGYADLPGVMIDLLLAHPQMASLFQRALQGDPKQVGTRLIKRWLDRLFSQGMATLEAAGNRDLDRADLAIHTIAMFNLTTGYFLSQRMFSAMVNCGGKLTAPENVARQKKLLARFVASARER